MSFAYEYSAETSGQTLVSLCEYGGDVVAEISASAGFAPVFAEMLELLFGETHYAVLEDPAGGNLGPRGAAPDLFD